MNAALENSALITDFGEEAETKYNFYVFLLKSMTFLL